ncbi:tetratricopeptide repeat protein [Methanolobus sp. ZRKC5]|uniref:tetratricopeptide repeat protein n=1 Tax=unclassified Methanolobus TaxID=2629569 RepID=UPI00313B0B45
MSLLRKLYDDSLDKKKIRNTEKNAVEAYSKGHVHLKLGYCEEAIDSYIKAEELWNSLGDIFSVQGMDKEASRAYVKAVETWFDRSFVLYKMGKNEEALELIDRTLEKQASNPKVFCSKALILFENKKYEDALKCLENALDLSVEDPGAWCYKGNTLCKLGRYDEALEAYDRSIELSNPQAFQFPRFAWISRSSSSQILPDSAQAWYCKGVALFELKRYDEAKKALGNLLEIEPEFENAIELRKLCSKKSKIESDQNKK